jgi:hypothetical protein
MDQPECFGSIRYITRVAPHRISRDPQLIDPFVYQAMSDIWGDELLKSFVGYTRSFYTLAGHYQNLWNFGVPHLSRPSDRLYAEAVKITTQAFRLDNPISSFGWDQLAQIPFIPSSSAGYGYHGKKGDNDNQNIAIGRAVYSLNAWMESEGNASTFRFTPYLAWTRTQLGLLENPKIRHVWGSAFHNLLLEGMSAAPLINAYANRGHPMIIGIQMYHNLPVIIDQVLGTADNKYVGIGTDLKNFDSSVRPWLIDDAFTILESNLLFPDNQSKKAFEYSKVYFKTKPVVMPDGRMWSVNTGVPSGSYYTQLVDSICNHIATTYAQLCAFGEHFKTSVLGDDSIFGIPANTLLRYPNFLTDMESAYARLGMKLKPEDTIVANNPQQLEFLGHVARGLTVDRELAKLLRLAVFTEQPITRPSLSLTRMKGLLIDSALQHHSLVSLYRYMKSIYETEEEDFPHEDANWLTSVMRITVHPSNLDLAKIWCLT